MKVIFSKSAFCFEEMDYSFDGPNVTKKLKFPDILVDLSKYVDPKLYQGSLHLLNRYMHNIFTFLYSLTSNPLSVMHNRYYSSRMSLFEKTLQTQLLISPQSCEAFSHVSDVLPRLRHCMGIDAGEPERADIIKILRRFTRMCHLRDEDESHPQNQKILYNFGKINRTTLFCLEIKICKFY